MTGLLPWEVTVCRIPNQKHQISVQSEVFPSCNKKEHKLPISDNTEKAFIKYAVIVKRTISLVKSECYQ